MQSNVVGGLLPKDEILLQIALLCAMFTLNKISPDVNGTSTNNVQTSSHESFQMTSTE